MALIKCPECGHMISDKAVKCPKCGFPIGQETAPAPNHVYPDDYGYDDRTSSSSRKWLFAAIGVLAVAVGVVAFLLLRNGQGQETADTESEKEKTYALAIPELGWLNIRESPSTSSKIVGKMRTCVDEAEVLGKEADWYKIRFDGVVGYINEPFSFVGTKEEVEEYRNTLRMPTYKQVMALWEWAPRKQEITEEDLSPLADFIPKMKFLKCDIDKEVSASDEYGWDEGNTYSSYWACYGMNITDVSVYDGWNAHFSTDQPRACGIIVQLDRDSYHTQVNLGAYFKDKADAEALFQQLKQNEKWKAENDGGETLYSTSSASTKGIEQKGEWYVICIKGVEQKQERREEETVRAAADAVERAVETSSGNGYRESNYSTNEDLSQNGNSQSGSSYRSYRFSSADDVIGWLSDKTFYNGSRRLRIRPNGVWLNDFCATSAPVVERFESWKALVRAMAVIGQRVSFFVNPIDGEITDEAGDVFRLR